MPCSASPKPWLRVEALRRAWRPFRPSGGCTALLVGALLFAFPLTISSNCDPYQRFYGYSFIRVDLAEGARRNIPFPFAFQDLYSSLSARDSVRRQDNIDEWHERFCRRPRREDMEALIYRASIPDLQQLRTAMSSPSIPAPPGLQKNSFARYLIRNECAEAVEYLIYAKRCEPFAVRVDPWRESNRDPEAMRALIREGRDRFLSVESHYFRLRYAYQMIRLAHYAGLHEEALALYDYTIPKTDHDPSLIEHWIRGHRAGALQALGRRPEAAYLYLLNFLYCPSRRVSALRSFRLRSRAEWEATLRLCRTDRERATLYAMRAYADDSRTIEEMETIYRIDPGNPHLEPLLVKEMTELERDLLGLSFNPRRTTNRRRFDRPRPGAGERVIDLQLFVRRVAEERSARTESADTGHPELWQVAEGYLEVIAGDYYAARQTFADVRATVDNPTLEEQLEVFEAVLKICSLDEINDATEELAARLYRSRLFERYPDFEPLLTDKLAALYQRYDMPGKLFLTRFSVDQLRPNPRPALVEDLLRLSELDDPNRLETQMLEGPDGLPYRDDLLDMKAVNFMQDDQLAAALEVLKEMRRARWNRFGRYNPFVERLNDCVHCPLPDTLEVFNRGEIIERILDMEYTARSEPALAAITYYRLGVALYNMTYFSHAWGAMDHFRSGASARRRFRAGGGDVFDYPGFPLGNREYMNCEPARFYFERARELSRNEELTARATFWAAKCARNAYFTDRSRGLRERNELFAALGESSANTRYYQRVINECKTYAEYASTFRFGN